MDFAGTVFISEVMLWSWICVELWVVVLTFRPFPLLQESYEHGKKCCVNIRPNRGFIQQLSQWEQDLFAERKTDITEPNFWVTD